MFMKLPTWIRLVFLLGSGLHVARLGLRRILHAFDRTPDLSIGPEGFGGLDNSGFHIIPWDKIETVLAHGPSVIIVGPEGGPRRFFGRFSPRRLRIYFSEYLFKISEAEVLQAIHFYRPTLSVQIIDKDKGWRWF